MDSYADNIFADETYLIEISMTFLFPNMNMYYAIIKKNTLPNTCRWYLIYQNLEGAMRGQDVQRVWFNLH